MAEADDIDRRLLPGLAGERPAQHQALAALGWLVGTWDIDGDYHVEGTVHPNRSAVFTFQWILGGQALLWKMVSHGPLKTYENHCVLMGTDDGQTCAGSYFDSMGTRSDVDARWSSDTELVISFDPGFVFLGPTVRALRCRIERHTDDRATWHLEADRGDGFEYLILQRGTKLYPVVG